MYAKIINKNTPFNLEYYSGPEISGQELNELGFYEVVEAMPPHPAFDAYADFVPVWHLDGDKIRFQKWMTLDKPIDSALIASIVFVKMSEESKIDDATIAENGQAFVVWNEHWTGKIGSIVRDEGKLYRSIHDVGIGQNTKPSDTPSMWTLIADPSEEWPQWHAPIGAHDAYPIGSKVSHNDKHWISILDNNIYEPGVYGWERQ